MAGKSNIRYCFRFDLALIFFLSSSLLLASYALPINALKIPESSEKFRLAKTPDERQPEAVQQGIEQIPVSQPSVSPQPSQPIDSPIPENVAPTPVDSQPTPQPTQDGSAPTPSTPTPQPTQGGSTPTPSTPTPQPTQGGSTPTPSTPTPQPTQGGSTPTPSTPTPQPTPQPTQGGSTPTPSTPTPQPTPQPTQGGSAPTPSRPTPQPRQGGSTPRPSRPTPQPTQGGSRPSRPTPQPTQGGSAPTPSRPTPQPRQGGFTPRPARPTPQPTQGGRKPITSPGRNSNPTREVSPVPPSSTLPIKEINFVDIAFGILSKGDYQSKGRYFHFYQFEGRENQLLQIRLGGSKDQRRTSNLSLQPFMFLLDPNNKVVLKRGSGGANSTIRDAFIFARLPVKGTYTIAVTSRNPKDIGRYSLALRNDRASYTLDESGELTAQSSTLKQNGSPYNVSQFQGKKNQLVSIRADSINEEFSPYIVLLNSQGQRIAANNDKDGMYSALIDRVKLPEDDTYYIVVTSNNSRERGTYRLTIF
ncbi:peptidase [Komarekiella sp. 'clone 1']|uniref:Peptidase n=2 Tax=Komarekiella TaxID=2022127 RepID=A0AA40ST21_9NOST|nr:peptidase [Komarekiella delphini-convector SJRDD-AB1]